MSTNTEKRPVKRSEVSKHDGENREDNEDEHKGRNHKVACPFIIDSS